MVRFFVRHMWSWPPFGMSSLGCAAVWIALLFLRFELFDPRFEDGLHGQLLQVIEGFLAKRLKGLIVMNFELKHASILMFFARVSVRHWFGLRW